MAKLRIFLAAAVLLSLGFCVGFFYQQSQSVIDFVNNRSTLFNGAQNLVPLSVNRIHDETSSPKTTEHFEASTSVTVDNVTPYHDVTRFVTLHDHVYDDGRRLGNQLSAFAAVVFVAELSGRKPVLRTTKKLPMESVFQLNLERVENLCPCFTANDAKGLTFDQNTEKQILKAGNKTILVNGYRHSWKYSMTTDKRLRRHLVFNDDIQRFVEDFLQRNIPPGWKKVGFLRVGIHVRRGDFLKLHKHGFTVANTSYFEKAMKFFIERYVTVQFIAMSDDPNWIIGNIVPPINISSTADVNVTYSLGHSAGQDLALLSMCDHVIMSTGSFGWWGAWLAKGTTIYYENWPRPGSDMDRRFTRQDFFPPSWIPMGD